MYVHLPPMNCFNYILSNYHVSCMSSGSSVTGSHYAACVYYLYLVGYHIGTKLYPKHNTIEICLILTQFCMGYTSKEYPSATIRFLALTINYS